ncbi:holo-ACP synthase [Chloroflexota bacterium]
MKPLVGTDIVETARIGHAAARWGDRFLVRVFTPREIEHCRGRAEKLAGRFAAKEAGAKLLGSGLGRIGWQDIETLALPGGQPQMVLHGHAQQLAGELGVSHISLSLSHTSLYAIAVAAAITEKTM